MEAEPMKKAEQSPAAGERDARDAPERVREELKAAEAADDKGRLTALERIHRELEEEIEQTASAGR